MTINTDKISEAVSQHLTAIEAATDFETLRENSSAFGYFVATQLKLLQDEMNAQERRISDLQTFAMQVKTKLER